MDVDGNVLGHEFKVTQGGRQIAEISKKWFHFRDSYGIEIKRTGRCFDFGDRRCDRSNDERYRLILMSPCAVARGVTPIIYLPALLQTRSAPRLPGSLFNAPCMAGCKPGGKFRKINRILVSNLSKNVMPRQSQGLAGMT